ncbi:RecB family exonuclease [Parapusillimonas sp. JC17]|uniref:RecB family exonuclease n=1 Tax=Parapusillimonas sp. JC17 TaxID=3445768 RepID=UPI003F9ED55A
MAAHVFTVRASSWAGLFDCAHRWEAEHLLGIRKPAGMRALLGTAVHAGTAIFDQGRVDGSGVTADEAAGAVVDTLRNPEFDVDRTQDGLSLTESERIGLTAHTLYCTRISPQFTFLGVENKLDPLEIECSNKLTVILTGTMDRARAAKTEDGPVIADVKTGTRVIEDGRASTRGRAAQVGTYQLMYEQTERVSTAGGQILALSTTSKPAAAVSNVFDARRVMVGTEQEPGLIEHAAAMFKTGLFPPNPSSPLCSPKYCSRWNTCLFRER